MEKVKRMRIGNCGNNAIKEHKTLLICVYTNSDRNEFAIGLKEDEKFRAVTKENEFYTRFVDVFDKIGDENEIDWKKEIKRWIAAAKKNETIFVEVDLDNWNEEGERKN